MTDIWVDEVAEWADSLAAEPAAGLEGKMLRLRAIADAKKAGASWSGIGAALGMSGKEAKRHVKQLAREAQRELIASRKG